MIDIPDVPETQNGSSCIIDSGSARTILNSKGFFHTLNPQSIQISTIAHTSEAAATGKASIVFPNGTTIQIDDAIYMPNAQTKSCLILGLSSKRFTRIHCNKRKQRSSESSECWGRNRRNICDASEPTIFRDDHKTSADIFIKFKSKM